MCATEGCSTQAQPETGLGTDNLLQAPYEGARPGAQGGKGEPAELKCTTRNYGIITLATVFNVQDIFARPSCSHMQPAPHCCRLEPLVQLRDYPAQLSVPSVSSPSFNFVRFSNCSNATYSPQGPLQSCRRFTLDLSSQHNFLSTVHRQDILTQVDQVRLTSSVH